MRALDGALEVGITDPDNVEALDALQFISSKIGIPYNASGLIHFVNHIGLNKAKEMYYTARPITARGALKETMQGEQLIKKDAKQRWTE